MTGYLQFHEYIYSYFFDFPKCSEPSGLYEQQFTHLFVSLFISLFSLTLQEKVNLS